MTFLSFNELKEMFGLTGNFMLYFSLRKVIQREDIQIETRQSEYVPQIMIEQKFFIKYINEKMHDKQNEIDQGLIYCEKQLSSKIEIKRWHKIRLNAHKISTISKLKYFQFKLLSGELTTDERVAKWKKRSNTTMYIFVIKKRKA